MASAMFRTKTTPCGVCLWKFACHDPSIHSFVLRSRAISYAGARAGPCFLTKGPRFVGVAVITHRPKLKKIAKSRKWSWTKETFFSAELLQVLPCAALEESTKLPADEKQAAERATEAWQRSSAAASILLNGMSHSLRYFPCCPSLTVFKSIFLISLRRTT